MTRSALIITDKAHAAAINNADSLLKVLTDEVLNPF